MNISRDFVRTLSYFLAEQAEQSAGYHDVWKMLAPCWPTLARSKRSRLQH
jgi:hypothetical protein